jgi:hypothetical protein
MKKVSQELEDENKSILEKLWETWIEKISQQMEDEKEASQDFHRTSY